VYYDVLSPFVTLESTSYGFCSINIYRFYLVLHTASMTFTTNDYQSNQPKSPVKRYSPASKSTRGRFAILEAAKTSLFDTSHWGSFCDVTLTLKQARKSDDGTWVKIDEHECKRAFHHFMNLLNQAIYKNAVKRHGKRIRVLPVIENGDVRSKDGGSGRWHIHCAIELPQQMDAIAFEQLIHECWAKVNWAHKRVLVRDGTDKNWNDYMLKSRQKSDFDHVLDCIDLDSLHNPIVDA
jgi:hypothetical protein